MRINPVNKNSIDSIEALNGVFRKTIVYNDTVMLCIFNLNKDAEIPLHNHEAHQIGFIIKGEVKFFTENDEFTAKEGDSGAQHADIIPFQELRRSNRQSIQVGLYQSEERQL